MWFGCSGERVPAHPTHTITVKTRCRSMGAQKIGPMFCESWFDFVAMWHDSAEMMNVQDAVIIFSENDYCCVANVAHFGRSVLAIRDPQVSARSVTPISMSIDALSEDPIPRQGCVLWKSSCVHGENHGKREGQTCRAGVVASVTWKPLDEHAFVQTDSNVHLSQHIFVQYNADPCCPHS